MGDFVDKPDPSNAFPVRWMPVLTGMYGRYETRERIIALCSSPHPKQPAGTHQKNFPGPFGIYDALTIKSDLFKKLKAVIDQLLHHRQISFFLA